MANTRVRKTVYVTHLFVPILLSGDVILVKAYLCLWFFIMTSQLEADCCGLVDLFHMQKAPGDMIPIHTAENIMGYSFETSLTLNRRTTAWMVC